MSERISVNKTYKLYIGGKFPRSESGQVIPFTGRKGQPAASFCKASRKDFREAVVAASAGLKSWRKASPYLRGQILYRAAEMLEGRIAQFTEELYCQGMGRSAARKEVQKSIDCMVYYAGWTDKIGQLFSSVNPVASPHFCFTVPQPTGIITILAGEGAGFYSIVESACRLLAGGNVVLLAGCPDCPLSASSLAEVWHTSDLPAGCVNVLTGHPGELMSTAASHRAVDGILAIGLSAEMEKLIQEVAADSLKRLRFITSSPAVGSPYSILDFMEMKTTWHPVGL